MFKKSKNKQTTDLKLRAPLLCLLLMTTFSCAPEPNLQTTYDQNDPKLSANVVYGTDGRLDVYQVTDDRLKNLAASTVALIKSADLVAASGGQTTVVGSLFGVDYNLCSSEKFKEQSTAAFCSGSLVGPDLVLTAGHCIETMTDCSSTSLVFGFAVQSPGALPQKVSTSNIYKCKEIVKTVRINTGADFALIRLDRPALDKKVLAVRRSGELNVGDELVVIGHPVGLPTKVTTGGRVRSVSNPDFVVANVDTFGGNSGSAVFNAQTGLIEGVLVRGEQDFVRQGSCNISYTCSEDGCRGEDITRISVARALIPDSSGGGGGTPSNPPVSQSEKFEARPAAIIPDNNSQGVLSSVLVGSLPQNRKVLINIDITHPYIGDLTVELLSADGKKVTLHSRAGGSADNIKKTYDVTSQLAQVQTAGSYKLIVKDLAKSDVGVLNSWSVEFK